MSGIPERAEEHADGAPTSLPDPLHAQLDLAVTAAQRRWRTPGVGVAIVRDGHVVYRAGVGLARLDPPTAVTDDTPFMVGSVTKTFTAVLVMRLRDADRLDLDDELAAHLGELASSPLGSIPVRRLLAHVSGLQREPVGRVWETLDAPDAERLIDGLAQARRVLAPHAAFHYSNLAYALLGQVVERLAGHPWEVVLADEVLRPLGMTRTGLRPDDDRAHGYLVHPFSGVPDEEPLLDLRATAPMGGLWSTSRDLARWAAFLADPDPQVLAPDTVAEMCRPMVMVDPDAWTLGYGLSLGMVRRGERIYVGHGGAMPGFLTGLRVSRSDRLGAVVWANSSAGADPIALAADLLDLVLAAAPTPPTTWLPEAPVPALDALLGSWWSEGEELVFSVREGRLWCAVRGAPELYDSRFAPDGPDRFVVDAGREQGEALELVRDEQGQVVRMYLATYAVTRDPRSFARLREQ